MGSQYPEQYCNVTSEIALLPHLGAWYLAYPSERNPIFKPVIALVAQIEKYHP